MTAPHPANPPAPVAGRLAFAVGLCIAVLAFTQEAVADPLRLAFLRPAEKEAPDSSPATDPHVDNTNRPQARRTIDSVRLLDENNPDYGRLQSIDEATRNLPYDANGFPDWMRALNSGLIAPRAGLRTVDKMEVLDLDIIMRNTKEMPHVRFPHRSHTLWLACSNCHPAPFKAQAGSTSIRMADIFRGKYCGQCHDRVAFITFFSCDRCHSVPQAVDTPVKPDGKK